MRAPVYRHIDSESTIGGLSIQGLLALLAVAFAAIQFLPFLTSVAVMLGAYTLLRLLSQNRPKLYWQHLLLFQLRQRRSGGWLCAAARAPAPPFPFAPYQIRDR